MEVRQLERWVTEIGSVIGAEKAVPLCWPVVRSVVDTLGSPESSGKRTPHRGNGLYRSSCVAPPVGGHHILRVADGVVRFIWVPSRRNVLGVGTTLGAIVQVRCGSELSDIRRPVACGLWSEVGTSGNDGS